MIHLASVGRSFIALALIAFGVLHVVYQGVVTRIFPAFPDWIPAQPVLAILLGVFLITTGASILFNKLTRIMCLCLGSTILLTLALFLLPKLFANLHDPMLWTNTGKALVLAGANFLVVGSLPGRAQGNAFIKGLERLLPLGKYFLAYFFIIAATLHFMYADFVATLIPGWIPAHLFWTYFAAIALIAGAIGMLVPRTAFLAASLSALMVFIWVVILHIPRALVDLHNSNEITSAFEATAMCGMALLVAAEAKANSKKSV